MKKKKDILFLCQFFYPEYISSAQLPFETAERLAASGFQVGALCGYPKEYCINGRVPLKECYKNISITRVRYLQLSRKTIIGRIVNYFSFICAVLVKIRRMKEYRCLMVYSNPPLLPAIAVLAKKFFKTRLVFVSYDVYPEIAVKAGALQPGSIIYKVFEKMNQAVFKNADRIIAVSEDMKEFLCEKRGVLRDKVPVIPNWYEDKGIIAIEKEVENELFQNIPKDAFVISYLGNLGTCQELDTVLDCINRLRDRLDIHFVFAGHGNKMVELKETVKQKQLQQVHIFGFLQGKDYEDILKISNVFVVTLLKNLKGLCSPSKAYSYMMAGKPILGIMDRQMELSQDIQEKHCGYIIPHGKDMDMADKIIKLKEDNHLAAAMGKCSRQTYLEKYEIDVCINKFKKLFAELLSE